MTALKGWSQCWSVHVPRLTHEQADRVQTMVAKSGISSEALTIDPVSGLVWILDEDSVKGLCEILRLASNELTDSLSENARIVGTGLLEDCEDWLKSRAD